jgi:hypothetical protein
MADDLIREELDAKLLEPKLAKKRLKKLEEEFETGLLTPWERYRILTDQLKQHTDIIEIADRKTRFALVILAALNTANVAFVVRPDLLLGGSVIEGGVWLGAYITLYAVLSLYMCVQAIGALKPRLSVSIRNTTDFSKAHSQDWLDLLSFDAIARRDLETYYELWRRAQFGQINREVALSVHSTSQIIMAKYKALERLYAGLLILVFLTAFLVLALTWARLAL